MWIRIVRQFHLSYEVRDLSLTHLNRSNSCWICLADYVPIRNEGNHRHRPDCRYYAAIEGINQRTPPEVRQVVDRRLPQTPTHFASPPTPPPPRARHLNRTPNEDAERLIRIARQGGAGAPVIADLRDLLEAYGGNRQIGNGQNRRR